MRRFTAAILAAAVCLSTMARADDDGPSAPTRGSCYLSQLTEMGLFFAIMHNPIGVLQAAMDGRIYLSPALAAITASAASARSMGLFYEPAEGGDWEWILTSKAGYRSIESNIAVSQLGEEGHFRIAHLDLNGHLVSDRWVVSINVPYQSWEGFGAYDELGGKSLAIQIAPQYFIMKQDSEVFDLCVFVIGGYEHNWFDGDPMVNLTDRVDDTDYLTWGAGAMIGKTFGFGDLSLGYIFQPWINMDGDEELDGTDTMEYHRGDLAYTFGLGGGFYGQLRGTWRHTANLPDQYDSDEYLGSVMLGYSTECWGAEASYGRTIESDDYREWSADLNVYFRW